MKDIITKSLLPLFALATAALTGWLANAGIITPDQVSSATVEIQNAFTALASGLGFVLALLFAWGLKKISGGNSGGGNSAGGSGGNLPSLLIMATALCLAGLGLSSCGSLSVTSDGCVLGSYIRDGKTYKAGPCVGTDGKVDRLRVAWSNDGGDDLQATVYYDKRPTLVEYRNAAGFWVKWSSKSGVMLGPVPTEVASSFAKDTPVEAATVTGSK